MTLANGDPFVVGDIFSFQQAERMKDNWRAVGAPSNPQAGSLWSKTTNDKLYHRKTSAWAEILQMGVEASGYIDLVRLSTSASGAYALRIDAYQDDVTALTGLLRGAYIQASNGALVATGTIRALELKARAGRPGETGNDIAVLEGLSISADAKTYDITTVMRGAEIILDGESGAITKAVGIRIAQNFQADIATLCYGLEIYRDSFDYDADIVLSSGAKIGGKAADVSISPTGQVGIGVLDSDRPLSICSDVNSMPAGYGSLLIYGDSNNERFDLQSTVDPGFLMRRCSGASYDAPGATLSGTTLGFLGFTGHDGVDWVTGSKVVVIAKAAENWTPTEQGTYLNLETTLIGSVGRALAVRITDDKKVGIGLVPTVNMIGLSIEAGCLTLKEIATPTADVNYGKIYTKDDNKLYFQDGAGTEHEVAYVP